MIRKGCRASTAFLSRKSALLGLALRFAFRDRSIAIFTEGLGPQKFHGRAVLLVNQHRASAAEMIAGFVKETTRLPSWVHGRLDPVYLVMTMAMIGANVVTRSVAGFLVAVLLFLPAEIHRARLEERVLEEKFGEAWRSYAARAEFFIPRFGRRRPSPRPA